MRQIQFTASLLALLMFLPAFVLAQVVVEPYQWQGTVNQNWGEPNNWTSNFGPVVPEGKFNSAAIISNGGTVIVNSPFNDSTTIGGPGNIQVQSGVLQIQNGGELQLHVPEGGVVQRSVQITDRLNIQGTGHLDAATLSLGAGSVLDIDFTPSTATPITLSGAATLGGTLNLDFSMNPATGSRTLMTAPSYGGSFSSIISTGLAPAVSVSVNRSGDSLLATVANVPTLTINRDTGVATVTNTHGTPISLDAYALRSAAGGLHPTNFAGIGIAGWTSAASNSSTATAQVFEGNGSVATSSLTAGFTRQLGNNGFFVTPSPQFFGQPTEDVVFEVTDPSLGSNPIRGVVNYTGKKVVNNTIALYINSSGNAALRNASPFAQEVEAYRIVSTSGLPSNALQVGTWNSLDAQNIDDGTWSKSTLSGPTQLLELQEGLTGQAGTTTFDFPSIYNIGKILNSGFTQQGFELEFLLAGASAFTKGEVVFDVLPTFQGLVGDYNNNLVVDAADYTLWRNSVGMPDGTLPNDGNLTGNIGPLHYNLWKSHFGETPTPGSGAVAAAVPEPASGSLLLLLVGLVIGMCRSRG